MVACVFRTNASLHKWGKDSHRHKPERLCELLETLGAADRDPAAFYACGFH